jgi:hypothetical protein
LPPESVLANARPPVAATMLFRLLRLDVDASASTSASDSEPA